MKTKYSLGVCSLADLVYTVLLIRVLCLDHQCLPATQASKGMGDWVERGGESGGKGGEFFLLLPIPTLRLPCGLHQCHRIVFLRQEIPVQ